VVDVRLKNIVNFQLQVSSEHIYVMVPFTNRRKLVVVGITPGNMESDLGLDKPVHNEFAVHEFERAPTVFPQENDA